jgi:nucleoside-diphosphate-sugar epimerase
MTKVLILGGTGAIGVYLVPELLRKGYEVHVTSRSAQLPINMIDQSVLHIRGNAQDICFLNDLLGGGRYDCIVDFMVYSTDSFRGRLDLFLNWTGHYIFLSSYRVFADTGMNTVTECSPRLLDVCGDKEYLKTDEYALAKAQQEDLLRESGRHNWTIVRPAITYSKSRFQLCTLEANTVIFRALHHVPVAVPDIMLDKETTMTWAGDVASMIAALALNSTGIGEDFNVCTSEHHSWREVAAIYEKAIGLKTTGISLENYIKIVGGRYQILYDRMFNRIMDNSKILKVIAADRSTITSLEKGLTRELNNIKVNGVTFTFSPGINGEMDRATQSRLSLKNVSLKEKAIYYCGYWGFRKALRKIGSRMKDFAFSVESGPYFTPFALQELKRKQKKYPGRG